MQSSSYHVRRGELELYFDRTAAQAWSRLTSDAPVSRIRATVRAGRDRMRSVLLNWLPSDLSGMRVLDAGCGTGAFAVEAARRGAQVMAIDLARSLVDLARTRTPSDLGAGSVQFLVGDMRDESLGEFDYVVAMDSLIHYVAPDIVRLVAQIAPRTRKSMLVTFAPRTAALAAMHAVGRLFPQGNRAPAIEPIRETTLRARLAAERALEQWQTGRTQRIDSGFYMSQALELTRR